MKVVRPNRLACGYLGILLGGAGVLALDSAAFSQNAANAAKFSGVEEVIVTARKREERLKDVPVPVTAVSAATLVENNQTKLTDFYKLVPGLSLSSDNRGASSITIRGLSTATFQNPT